MSSPAQPRKISCPKCAAVYTIPHDAPARTVKCRVCQTAFAIGGETAPIPPAPGTMTAPKPATVDSVHMAATVDIRAQPGAVAPPQATPATIQPTALPVATPLTAPAASAATRSVQKGAVALAGAVAWQGTKHLGRATGYVAKQTWRGTRQLYALGTGPERKKYLPRIAVGAVAVLLLLGIGLYSLGSRFSTAPSAAPTKPGGGGDVAKVQPTTPEDTRPKLERVPRQLVIRHELNQEHPVTFNADLKFASKDARGGNPHTFSARCTTHFRETTKHLGDEDQNPVVRRLQYQDCKLVLEYDNNQDAWKFPDQDEILNNVSRMATLQRLSRRNNQSINFEMDLSKEVDDPRLRRSYANFHGQLTMLLSMLRVPMPPGEKPIKPRDTWTEGWELSMASGGGKGQVHSTTYRYTYTYQGVRRTNGREEAVIRVNVETRTKGEEAMSGDGEGEAILDMKAAQISSVKLKVDMKTDTSVYVIDGDSKATGTVKLELQRDVTGGP